MELGIDAYIYTGDGDHPDWKRFVKDLGYLLTIVEHHVFTA